MKKFGVASLLLWAGAGFAQPVTAGKLSFEVVSIKPSGAIDPAKIQSGQQKVGQVIDKARVEYHLMPLFGLMSKAYDLQLSQITGPPSLLTDRWEIFAKMPEGATKDDIPEMLKSLFVDRFGMKAHFENKEQSVYVLSQGKGGSKLVEAQADSLDQDQRQKAAEKGETVVDAGDAQVRVKNEGNGSITATTKGTENGTVKTTVRDGMMVIDIQSMTIEQLCQQLSVMLGKPVVDKTELKGRYSMALEFSLAELQALAARFGAGPAPGGASAQAPEAADPGGGASMFKSVEKLGLKLEATKAPVKQLVIDHIEKTPTDN